MVRKMLDEMCPMTHVQLGEYVLGDVLTTIPDDVVQGVLLMLRTGRTTLNKLRSVGMSAMGRNEFQAALELMRACSGLQELRIVDGEGGVAVPKEVVNLLDTLSILRPHTYTLEKLHQTACSPKAQYLVRLRAYAAQLSRS